MDDLIQATIRDISTGPRWTTTPEVRQREVEVNSLYHEVLAGKARIEDFITACELWKETVTR